MASFWTQIFFLSAIAGVGIISWTIYKIFYKIFDLQDNPQKTEKQSRPAREKRGHVGNESSEKITPHNKSPETKENSVKEDKPVKAVPISDPDKSFTPPTPPALNRRKLNGKQKASAEPDNTCVNVNVPEQEEANNTVETSFVPPSAPVSQKAQSKLKAPVKTPPAREESSAKAEKAEEERVFIPPSAPRKY